MLSSCADYTTTSSQNSQTNHPQLTFLDYYSSSQTTNRTTYSTDDSFSINFNSQNEIKQENQLIDITQNQNIVISPKTISNTSSPSKHRVLNTPERLDQVREYFLFYYGSHVFFLHYSLIEQNRIGLSKFRYF